MVKRYIQNLILAGLIVYLMVPFAVFSAGGTATTPPKPSGFDVAAIMGKIITYVWQFFAGLAVIMFIVAGIMFITSSGDPSKITTARNAFIWGVVGVIVAIVAFSIVQIVSGWV